MKRSKLATILKKAEMISKAVEAEAEEILEDAEKAIKECVPACDVHKALLAVEQELNNEGVEALFQKSTSKVAMKRTAGEALSADELKELVKKITKAIVEEFEDVLKDTDEVCDDEVKSLKDAEDIIEVEGKLKGLLEKKLADKGIYTKLARNAKATKVAKKVAKKVNSNEVVADKTLSAMKKNRTIRK